MDEIMALPNIEGVIFITHDLDLAIAYANRVWLMRDGAVVADGTPDEVLSDASLLERCGLRPTSLLQANLALLPRTGRFLRAEALAAYAGTNVPGERRVLSGEVGVQ
jgi:energy-coupling factor transport system ATP-binding protein